MSTRGKCGCVGPGGGTRADLLTFLGILPEELVKVAEERIAKTAAPTTWTQKTLSCPNVGSRSQAEPQQQLQPPPRKTCRMIKHKDSMEQVKLV